jgi:hypothetical protein
MKFVADRSFADPDAAAASWWRSASAAETSQDPVDTIRF